MTTAKPVSLEGLPGGDQITKGLQDFQSRVDSMEACLVQICAPKLALCGYELPTGFQRLDEPELHLYSHLEASGGDAYSRYNALLRTLSSFGRALETRNRRAGNCETQSQRVSNAAPGAL